LRDHLSGLQAHELREIMTEQYYNPQVMKGAKCLVDSIFYTSPYDLGSLYFNNRIRLYIHNLRELGINTSDKYALIGDFENVKDMFLMKVSRSPEIDNLSHELIIGIYGTNSLRKHIPNYAYIYGGFKCSPPLIDP